MAKRRIPLAHPRVRSILTDMLPFEVPPTFSNRGFYSFLLRNGVELRSNRLSWIADSPALDSTMFLIFGPSISTQVTNELITEFGKTVNRRSVKLLRNQLYTTPFTFRIAHGISGRSLSVIHPRNQITVAEFYEKYSALIIYYSSLSSFSIRRPVSVSRYVFFKDGFHKERAEANDGIEMANREYEQLGSYFVYRKFRNIHRFFESDDYHRCERKYTAMVQVDVAKCFDSIYTHSATWATLGKSQAKFNTKISNTTFAGHFDTLMQSTNQKETNGIVIGPEFSRIFAEIILQSVDVEILRNLEVKNKVHKRDYEIFRYVDDYFIFYRDSADESTIINVLQESLTNKKLSINAAKVKNYEKPIITELTIAKDRASSLLNDHIRPEVETTGHGEARLICDINSNQLIVKYKTIIKETGVNYENLLNYTLAIAENKVNKLLSMYGNSSKIHGDQKRLVTALVGIIEFCFFIYSASPKVNHTVRICRIIQTCATFLHSNAITYELKHTLFKYVHDAVVELLEKNLMSAFHEIESLYLITMLSQIGKEYWLPEATLAKYFMIETDDDTGSYFRSKVLSHFSVTVLLAYIRNKVRYNKLRSFIENHVEAKLEEIKEHCLRDAEALMLFMDMVTCPHISSQTKSNLATTFGLTPEALVELQAANNCWFTSWGPNFDLGRELDAKRSLEVY